MKVKINRVLIICILSFLGFAIYYNFSSDRRFYKLMESKGVYTIGTIDNVESLSKGGPLSKISYHFDNSVHFGQYIGDISSIPKPQIGKHFFIKIIPDDPTIGILFRPQCLAPDSLTVAPDSGWSASWMKNHFPDCAN